MIEEIELEISIKEFIYKSEEEIMEFHLNMANESRRRKRNLSQEIQSLENKLLHEKILS